MMRCVCVYVCMYACVHISIVDTHQGIYDAVCVCVCVCVYVCMFVCVYISIVDRHQGMYHEFYYIYVTLYSQYSVIYDVSTISITHIDTDI